MYTKAMSLNVPIVYCTKM